jgi:hypothetical protein
MAKRPQGSCSPPGRLQETLSPVLVCFREDLTALVQEGKKTVPRYLAQPEVIFSPLWQGRVDDNAFNLAD